MKAKRYRDYAISDQWEDGDVESMPVAVFKSRSECADQKKWNTDCLTYPHCIIGADLNEDCEN